MKKLDGIYEVLRHNLLEISSQCENLNQSIEESADIVLFLPVIMVNKKTVVN